MLLTQSWQKTAEELNLNEQTPFSQGENVKQQNNEYRFFAKPSLVVRHTTITPNKLDLTLETCSTNFIAYYFTHIYRLFTGHEIKTQY